MDREQLKEIIRACGSLEDAAWKLRVRPSTLKKLLLGQPVSCQVAAKISARLKTRFGVVSTELPGAKETGDSTPGMIRKAERIKEGQELEKFLESGKARTERLFQVHRLYEEKGTLSAVGRELGITRERVRQLLVQGARLGLFDYLPRAYPVVPKAKLVDDYLTHLNLNNVARANNTSLSIIKKLLTAYGISNKELKSLRKEGQKARCVKEYHLITQQLGHHPTTTEIQRRKAWKYLDRKINKLWGSIDGFRTELSVPKPPQGNPRFSEDVQKWRQHKREIAVIRRIEHLDRIRECLKLAGALSAREIAAECGLKLVRAWFLIKLLLTTGEITKTGSSAYTKYQLTSGRNFR